MLKYTLFLLLLSGVLFTSQVNSSTITSMSGKLPPAVDYLSYRKVWLQLRIMHIYDINLDHQTVRLSGYFRQSWNDTRMMGNQWDGETPNGRRFFLMNKVDALWYPDTFISNSIDHQDRQSFSGDPHGAYHYFRVYTDGEVLYSQMIDILIKIEMNLKYYPFNVLNISLDVESYGYPDHTLQYRPGNNFDDDNGLVIKIGTVPGYEIMGGDSDDRGNAISILTTATYGTGNFSMIKMYFNLIPNESTVFILSIPNLLLIVISSFVFWMDVKKKLSERLSLGITAMLADFALSFSLPVPSTPDFMYVREYINISYIFIGFSIFFTFTEYIIVSFFYNVKSDISDDNKKAEVINMLPKRKRYNSIISKSVKNLKASFNKLLNMNELLKYSLIEYVNNSLPEEPVMPIKAALGIFYLSSWVTFMLGHIIPGRLIMDKARLGINYHQQAVQYFPVILGVGIGISFGLSILAFYVQYKSRCKWAAKLEKREKLMNSYPSQVETLFKKDTRVDVELKNSSLERIENMIKDQAENLQKKLPKSPIIVSDIDIKLKKISDDIDKNLENMNECINNMSNYGLDDSESDNESNNNNTIDDSKITITVVDDK